jgi:TolB-like protein/tRNA A-37 threonylcarbamoyl transferase component Bud32/Tfp pilus assembly protein PilF
MSLRDQLQETLGSAYALERELGGGGMSRVFVATETRLKRSVVVKLMSPELAAGVSADRFEREIQLAASLQQANIVPLLAAGDMSGVPYYTMPFVEGESLRALLATRGALSIPETIGILRDVARALSYAHAHGVVHRDIKPDNVLLSHGTAVVTDFGIAKAISAARTATGHETLTQVGTSIGTPSYMSPEQVAGDPEVDHRADIYAFGCMAYELLAGRPPFIAQTPQRVLAAHLTDTPQLLRELRPETPSSLASLIQRCLAKAPADRPASAHEIVQALEAITTPSGGHATSGVPRMSRVAARRVGLVGVAAAVILLLTAAGVVWRGRAVSADTADRSIAVLPLTNLSGEKSNDYFGEGLAEEITDALAKAGLRVIGRGTARTLVGRGMAPQAVAQQLGVGAVLQGSVQRADNRLRITVSLLAAKDGALLWGDKYDRDIKDVFAVQDEIARSVAGQLRVKLAGAAGGRLVRKETDDPEAHALYLQGLYLWNRRTARTVRQAIGFFEQALQRDPGYARAQAGIAMGYVVLPTYADVPPDDATSKGREAARRALAIDSTLPEAQSALALAYAYDYENANAERAFARSLTLDSTFATTYFWHALLLGHVGRFDEAILASQRAHLLEPASLIIQTDVAQQLYNAGRFAAADSATDAVLRIDSTFQLAMAFRGKILVEERRYDEAIAILERVNNESSLRASQRLGVLAYAYARAGRVGDARATLARLPKDPALAASGDVAAALDALGERDAAVAMFERAVAQHDQWILIAGRAAPYAELRKDPRVAPLFTKIEAP